MEFKFNAQHRLLGLSECERLCGTGSREIEGLAQRAGWRGAPGERVNVSVGTALNMSVLSIVMKQGIELQSMAAWLPGLREGALLELGMNTSNWLFEGSEEAGKTFWPMLWGNRDVVRPRIAPLLGCYSTLTTHQLRFFSPSDVECLTSTRADNGQSGRTPRFTIYAHAIAEHLQVTCGSPLFTATTATPR